MSLREQRRLVKRRGSDPEGLRLTRRLLEHSFLVRPPFGGGKCDVSLLSSPPLFFWGGDPEDREIIGRGGVMKAAAVRSDHALLRAGAGGGRELKRGSGSEAAGNLQALRRHEIRTL